MGSALPSHEAEVRAEGKAGCSELGAQGTRLCWETWRRPAVGKGLGAACTSFPPTVDPSRQANIPVPSWQVTDLHQELAEARRALTELESEREQKQRDFDRKLLLAKSRIETEEASPTGRVAGSWGAARPVALPWLIPPLWVLQAEKERLAMEVRDLQQRMRFLQEQLAPVTRQREYQEKEIQRLNKVGARAQPLPAKRLLCSPASSSLKSKTDPDQPLPAQLFAQVGACVRQYPPHRSPQAPREGGWGGGVSWSLLLLPSCTRFPRWACLHGPLEMSWAQHLALTTSPCSSSSSPGARGGPECPGLPTAHLCQHHGDSWEGAAAGAADPERAPQAAGRARCCSSCCCKGGEGAMCPGMPQQRAWCGQEQPSSRSWVSMPQWWEAGTELQHLPGLQMEGPWLGATVATYLPEAWCSWWDQRWQRNDGGGGGCFGEVPTLGQVHPHPSLLPGENFRGGLPA